MPRSLINTLIVVICATTIIIFVFSKNNLVSFVYGNPLLFVSQAFSLIGTVLFSLSFILSSRLKIIDNLFNGLDKAYRTHHIIGIIGFLLLLNHPILLIIKAFLQGLPPALYIFPGSNYAYNAGIYSLSLLIFLMLFASVVKVAYPKWKNIHKFMGLALIFGLMRVNTISSDVSRSPLLRIWILFFLLSGFLAYIYKLLIYKYFPKPIKTIIHHTLRKGDILEIYLKAEKRENIKFNPGQQFFLTFKNSKIISNEEHPFSISSSADQELLRFSVKNLGDFTSKLLDVEVGATVELRGPFGHFLDGVKNSSQDLVFIAGGIGITPFLSLIPTLTAFKKQIYIFYLSKNKDECVYEDELEKFASTNSNMYKIRHLSEELGHYSIEDLKKAIRTY